MNYFIYILYSKYLTAIKYLNFDFDFIVFLLRELNEVGRISEVGRKQNKSI